MEQLRNWLNAERGRRSDLASKLEITSGALSQWSRVPADRAIAVEAVTGISRHELRPDIFGPVSEPAQ